MISSSTTVFNIYNNQKCNQQIRMISKGSYDTKIFFASHE